MEEKKSKIAAFIESLPEDSTMNGVQSAVFSSELTVFGGDNGGDCINETATQCDTASNGGRCRNYNSACSHSENKGNCVNTTLRPNIPINYCQVNAASC